MEQFDGLTPLTPKFDAQWRELARTDPGFGHDQHDFVGRSHYGAQVAALEASGLDLSDRGMAVQDAVWSTAVQFRNLTPGVFNKGLTAKFGAHSRTHHADHQSTSILPLQLAPARGPAPTIPAGLCVA